MIVKFANKNYKIVNCFKFLISFGMLPDNLFELRHLNMLCDK